MAGVADQIILNRADLACEMGVSEQTVDRWITQGCPVERKGSKGTPYRFDLAAVQAWRGTIDAQRREQRSRIDEVVRQSQQQSADRQDRGASLEKAALEAEILRMRAERDCGELVPAIEVRATFERAFGYLAQFLQALPDRIALQAGLDPVTQDRLQIAIDTAQVELARELMAPSPGSSTN